MAVIRASLSRRLRAAGVPTSPDFDTVNVLASQSRRAQRLPRDNEFLIDAADGLDWETLVRCDFIWVARKVELKESRGRVTPERRRVLGQKAYPHFRFLARLGEQGIAHFAAVTELALAE